MIVGSVQRYQAVVPLTLIASENRRINVEFVLDTGFMGFLTLPPSACSIMGLPYLRPQPANLADGTPRILEVYELVALWNGKPRAVEVLAMEQTPLLGMLMLDGCDVQIQVAESGLVSIDDM